MKYFDPFLALDEFSGGLSLLSPVSSWYVMGRLCIRIEFRFCLDFVILNFAVTAPAGFPDHPHRGSAFIPSISFFVCKIIHVHES